MPFCSTVLRAENRRPGYPDALQTLGDHIRARRLDLGLTQAEAAERMGVTEATVNNWERNRTEPMVHHYPAVIAFLGYNPLPEPSSFAERLAYARQTLGLSRKELARRVGTDVGCIAGWEQGTTKPTSASVARLGKFLGW